MPSVNYFSEDTDFSLKNKKKISNWISSAVSAENKKLKEINYIFCSDQYLFDINKSYLNHTTLTDIITFDNSETKEEIEGDIFISVDRINENKDKFRESFEKELLRVIIHGVLHLIGYKDKLTGDKKKMAEKEDYYLSLLQE
jgi:probable rRNA maturation factor